VRSAAVLVAIAMTAPSAARAGEVVRIAVVIGADRVDLSAPGLAATPLREGAAPRRLPRGAATVALEGGALTLDGEPLDAPAVLFAAEAPIRAGALSLSGDVEVRRGAKGLDVVHALPLEDYVAAVTGSEMPPAFPAAALEAQAVAARTFAVF
jgi:stage II sporulation protein D